MEVFYKPSFIRQLNKLPKALQVEALEKIELFKDPKNHSILKVHTLKGKLTGRCSFSVNYKYRILFNWEMSHTSAVLLAIGDHAIYD